MEIYEDPKVDLHIADLIVRVARKGPEPTDQPHIRQSKLGIGDDGTKRKSTSSTDRNSDATKGKCGQKRRLSSSSSSSSSSSVSSSSSSADSKSSSANSKSVTDRLKGKYDKLRRLLQKLERLEEELAEKIPPPPNPPVDPKSSTEKMLGEAVEAEELLYSSVDDDDDDDGDEDDDDRRERQDEEAESASAPSLTDSYRVPRPAYLKYPDSETSFSRMIPPPSGEDGRLFASGDRSKTFEDFEGCSPEKDADDENPPQLSNTVDFSP